VYLVQLYDRQRGCPVGPALPADSAWAAGIVARAMRAEHQNRYRYEVRVRDAHGNNLGWMIPSDN